ncbi:type VI secretion system lipoprotein TssJ [Caldimonas brevitalea]|uniref:Type VI secretion system protein VasD n=1 Tax=Caldimonas brevitalea TaxID=413882 RepID=A0A0G3BPQ3_9BURK|nr:type VI secretion system lipoprotein TssJ [Caldimonas brevitalea]AKJ28550.1 type VI secretion system protein VasD [Caldimonas brevitalea]
MQSRTGQLERLITRGFLVTGLLVLAGCETAGKAVEAVGNAKDKALQVTGLVKKAPELPDSALPARRVTLRIQASDSLNVDPSGQSLSLVMRIYKLKSADAFLSTPYDAFGNPAREKEHLGDDVVEVRDLQLVPGQRYETQDKVDREASYIGVVALLRAPAPQRWKYAFAAEPAQKTGITMGAHACSLSVSMGAPVNTASSVASMSPGQCP